LKLLITGLPVSPLRNEAHWLSPKGYWKYHSLQNPSQFFVPSQPTRPQHIAQQAIPRQFVPTASTYHQMGGAVSLFDQNDWNIAGGGLTGEDETIDGRPPTASYETYHLLKKAVLANQREFDVTDSKSNLIYTVRPSTGTIAGFDILGVNAGPNEDDLLIHVAVDIARRYWTIYRVNRPFYPGQLPDEEATAKLATDLTKKDIATLLSESLAVTSFVEAKPTTNEGPITTTEGVGSETEKDQQPVKYVLYKACCVTVSWSRYMAVASYYGPPSADQILSYNAKSAPLSDAVMEGVISLSLDDGGDVDDAASSERRSKRDETKNHTDMMEGEDEKKADTTEERSKPTVQSLVPDDAHVETSKDESAMTLGTQISSRTLADDLGSDSEATSVDDVEDLENRVILEMRSQHELDDTLETPSLTTSSSMPELTQTRQLSFRSWFNQKSRDWQKNIAQTNFNTKPTEQDGSPKTQQQTLQSLFPMGMKVAKLPNPDEGVVHLDKPLLLCQEIYNKIIGNHQTSRVTKERVMKLLKQDMEQHERNEEKAGNDESSSIEVIDGRGPMVCAVSESPGSGVEESKEDVHAQEATPQPLVGYWNWEHTIRAHKMKMHLAKGSDLSLHVVLAVLVNQVRYERNAIAMTV
jgi:hypothetical protein